MLFYKLPDTINEDIEKYNQLVNDYLENKIDKNRLKIYRVPMGCYEQRQDGKFMVRIRFSGGAFTPVQLQKVAELSLLYSDTDLHFTTRQEVQIHNLNLTDTVTIMKKLLEVGLSSRGGGGNTVRNITASPWRNSKNETFDVTPYAAALTTRLISENDSWQLPRKFKISFSNSDIDNSYAVLSDVGFIAKVQNKKKGFKVFAAGGLGAGSSSAILLFDFIIESEIYNIAKSLKTLFDRYGNRKSKYKARLRFLVKEWGEDEFRKKFEEIYTEVKNNNYSPLIIEPLIYNGKGIINIPLYMGDMNPAKALKLVSIINDYGENILRATVNQNLMLLNIPEEKIDNLKTELMKNNLISQLPVLIDNGTVCAGASRCRLGICLSRGLFNAIKNKLESFNDYDFDKLNDITLKISGCPNSCGQHLSADIGFYGTVKRIDNRYVPHYNLVMGYSANETGAELSQLVTSIPAKSVPDMLLDLLLYVQQNRHETEKISDYLKREKNNIVKDIILNYLEVPDYNVDLSFYYDWDSDKLFSIAEKLEGECSAGVYDLINWEFSNINKYIDELDKCPEKENELTDKIIISSARALLITKGCETDNDREAVNFFNTHFIGNHIDISYKTTTDKWLNNEMITKDEAVKLYKTVFDLYNNMDVSLKFPELTDKIELKESDSEIKFKDLRGVNCPINYVKVKLEIETMPAGSMIEVLLDDGEPIENVPASLKSDGHTLLNKEKVKDYWKIKIRK